MGLHWVYSTREIAVLLRKDQKAHDRKRIMPEWLSPPASRYYEYQSGQSTPYGEEMIVLLEAMGQRADGALNLADFGTAYLRYCRDGCREERCKIQRLNGMSQDFCRIFDEKKEQGAFDSEDSEETWKEQFAPKNREAHSMVKIVPLVARYAGLKAFGERVRAAMRMQQSDPQAVEYGMAAARILEQVVLGGTVADALRWAGPEGGLVKAGYPAAAKGLMKTLVFVNKTLEAAPSDADASTVTTAAGDGTISLKRTDGHSVLNGRFSRTHAKFTAKVGAGCDLPGPFLSGLHILAGESIRTTIVAGGDQASRSIFIGACLAAELGRDSMPSSWLHKAGATDDSQTKVRMLADKIVAGWQADYSAQIAGAGTGELQDEL